MKAETFSLSWVDVVVVLLLTVGLMRGRKRGMSEELLDIVKWAIIVVAAGLLYEPAGRFLSQTSVFSLLSCYVAVYAGIVLFILILFAVIRRSVGQKVVGSDVFGGSEYYLGMVAGVFRYACILLVFMAFLHARYYSSEEVAAKARYQQDNFGSSFFVTLPDLQQEVFKKSLAGRTTQKYLPVVLIRPTAPENKSLSDSDTIGRRREGSVRDAMR